MPEIDSFDLPETTHNLNEIETNSLRFDDFKNSLELSINTDNSIAEKINFKIKKPELTDVIKIGNINYKIIKQGEEVYAYSGTIEPIYLGKTKIEVKTSIDKLKQEVTRRQIEEAFDNYY